MNVIKLFVTKCATHLGLHAGKKEAEPCRLILSPDTRTLTVRIEEGGPTYIYDWGESSWKLRTTEENT